MDHCRNYTGQDVGTVCFAIPNNKAVTCKLYLKQFIGSHGNKKVDL